MKQVILFFLLLTGTVVSQNYHYALEEKQSATTDTEAPIAPIELIASEIASTTATLTWTESTDNIGIVSYRIYNNGELLAATGNVNSYYLTGLTAETIYNITVRAVDAANNESPDSNLSTFTTLAGGPNLPNEDALFDCYLLPIERKNELQSALDTYGCVRLEDGDYGWSGSAITMTSNQKLYGHPTITRIPNIIIAAGSTGVQIENINCGYSGQVGVTFEAGDPITNCKFKAFDFTPVRAIGAKIEDCEFIGFRNTQIIWDMSVSGYFRNNKFIKHTIQNNIDSQYAQHHLLGNDLTPSYGNVISWVNYLTASSTGAYIDNVDDIRFVGIDMESWNWDDTDLGGIGNLHIINTDEVIISGFQGATVGRTFNLPAYHIEANKTFMTGASVGSPSNEEFVSGNIVTSGANFYSADVASKDLRLFDNNISAQFNGVSVTAPLTNQADIDSLKSVILTTPRTPWAKPTRVTLPNPTGSNWSSERVGKPDSHAYIQGLVNNGQYPTLPEGIYYVSEPIVMPMDKGLIGEGTGKTVIVAITDDFPIIQALHDVENLGSKTGKIIVTNMTLQGGSVGIQLTSNADPNAPAFPGSAYYSDCLINNIIFRDNTKGINIYKTYGLDNNYFEHLYFINNDIGFHQQPYEGVTEWTSPFTSFIDKTFLYKCEFINNGTAIYFNAVDRPNNLNAFQDCIFDGCSVISNTNRQNTGLIINSIIRNSSGAEPLTKGTSNFSYTGCLFENNSVPYLFGNNGSFTDCDLLDAIPLFSGGVQFFATNSTILGTVPNKDGVAVMINSSIPNEPTFNKMAGAKGYLTPFIVVLDEAPNPYPQLLVKH